MSVIAPVVGALAGAAIGGLLMARASRQCRKPSDRAGRVVLQRMNESHAPVTQWGLSHVAIGESFTILDVGCGGGRTIDRLASMATKGKVVGVDYSAESVATARETNASAVAQGRVAIEQASVSQLPFPDGTFDLVTAVETHYYWPDLPRDVREVMRVLKPGGTFVIIAETYRGRRNDWLYRPTMTLVLRAAYLTPDEHRLLLSEAGHIDVQVFEEKAKGWICAMGTRPT
ncbi:MAG TPA: class I SAM-dependent methyltransferase [Gemmatimonadaceae bacterium]|nr:class I SAM-dependent methyltransferase [Gemmatimonadaceae bacterium]